MAHQIAREQHIDVKSPFQPNIFVIHPFHHSLIPTTPKASIFLPVLHPPLLVTYRLRKPLRRHLPSSHPLRNLHNRTLRPNMRQSLPFQPLDTPAFQTNHIPLPAIRLPQPMHHPHTAGLAKVAIHCAALVSRARPDAKVRREEGRQGEDVARRDDH